MKKLIAVLISLSLLVSLFASLPVTVSAAETYYPSGNILSDGSNYFLDGAFTTVEAETRAATPVTSGLLTNSGTYLEVEPGLSMVSGESYFWTLPYDIAAGSYKVILYMKIIGALPSAGTQITRLLFWNNGAGFNHAGGVNITAGMFSGSGSFERIEIPITVESDTNDVRVQLCGSAGVTFQLDKVDIERGVGAVTTVEAETRAATPATSGKLTNEGTYLEVAPGLGMTSGETYFWTTPYDVPAGTYYVVLYIRLAGVQPASGTQITRLLFWDNGAGYNYNGGVYITAGMFKGNGLFERVEIPIVVAQDQKNVRVQLCGSAGVAFQLDKVQIIRDDDKSRYTATTNSNYLIEPTPAQGEEEVSYVQPEGIHYHTYDYSVPKNAIGYFTMGRVVNAISNTPEVRAVKLPEGEYDIVTRVKLISRTAANNSDLFTAKIRTVTSELVGQSSAIAVNESQFTELDTFYDLKFRVNLTGINSQSAGTGSVQFWMYAPEGSQHAKEWVLDSVIIKAINMPGSQLSPAASAPVATPVNLDGLQSQYAEMASSSLYHNIVSWSGASITADDFTSRLSAGVTASYIRFGGQAIAGTGLLGTETTVIVNNQNEITYYKLCLYGDVDGDGTISLSDLVLMKKSITETSPLSGIKLIAADIDRENGLTANDIIKAKKIILGVS